MILTSEERTKFAAYLRQDAASDKMIFEQLKTVSPHLTPLLQSKAREIAAKEIVAQILESTEQADLS